MGLNGGRHLNLADASDEEIAERAAAAMMKFSQWFAARMRQKHRDRNGVGERKRTQRERPTSELAARVYLKKRRAFAKG